MLQTSLPLPLPQRHHHLHPRFLHSSPPNPTPPTPLPAANYQIIKSPPQNDIAEDEVKQIDHGVNFIEYEDSTWINSSEIPPEYLSPTEKPLVSARFGHQKPLKSSPEGGRALRMVKAEEHETLESTWKAITEGGGGCRQKSDVWGPLEVRKSATFKDRASHHQPPVSKLRKEPSLSQDELNRRVEAFIRNFNQQMRLQRQESLNQNMQMINSGSN